MNKAHFRSDNTDGYSASALARLNEIVERLLIEMGDAGEDDPNHLDNLKNAGDWAHNNYRDA